VEVARAASAAPAAMRLRRMEVVMPAVEQRIV
jgi:hypothetical protein